MKKLEQKISDDIANDIRKEIDEGIMFSMLKFSDCHALCSKYSRTNTFIVTYFTTS